MEQDIYSLFRRVGLNLNNTQIAAIESLFDSIPSGGGGDDSEPITEITDDNVEEVVKKTVCFYIKFLGGNEKGYCEIVGGEYAPSTWLGKYQVEQQSGTVNAKALAFNIYVKLSSGEIVPLNVEYFSNFNYVHAPIIITVTPLSNNTVEMYLIYEDIGFVYDEELESLRVREGDEEKWQQYCTEHDIENIEDIQDVDNGMFFYEYFMDSRTNIMCTNERHGASQDSGNFNVNFLGHKDEQHFIYCNSLENNPVTNNTIGMCSLYLNPYRNNTFLCITNDSDDIEPAMG